LDLKGNNIGDDGMRAIGNALLSAASSSVTALGCDAFDVPRDAASLDLSSKGLSPAAAVLLAGVLRGNSSITKLNLGGNKLGAEGGKIIADMLPQTKITSLDLGYNNIGVEGGKALAAVLPQTQITSLNLSENSIGVEGGKALAAVLPQTMITTLGVDGYALQIDELRGTKPAEKINLSDKRLGVASAVIIAACIKENSVLKELNLSENSIGTEGGKVLAAVLPQTNITSLNLEYNGLDENAKQRLRKAAAGRVKLDP